MSERDALYAAVLAAPADDLPRLVYADWCDDHGEPDRAEFIRVQIELARLPAGDHRRGPLGNREDELLALGHDRWKVQGIRGVQVFVRGFVERWDGTADWLLAAAGRLFESAPVRAVRVRNADKAVIRLASLTGLAQVDELDLSGNTLAAHERLGWLLGHARLGRLRSLTVGNNRLFADALPQIANSPVAGRLATLDLSGNPLGDEGLVALAGHAQLRGLDRLILRNNEQSFEDTIQDEGVVAFAQAAGFDRLSVLDVTGHVCHEPGFIALLDSTVGRMLRELRLAQNWVGEFNNSWAEELTRPDRVHVPRLIDLSGRRTTVGTGAAERLARWPRLADGVTLDLRGCSFTGSGQGYAVLAASPYRGAGLLIDPNPPEVPE